MFGTVRAIKPGMYGVLALTATIQWVAAAADPRANPYGQIVDRNVFGLKPPPPPQVEAPKEEVKPPPNVKLTGISNLAQKRAFIEVTDKATGDLPIPGKPYTFRQLLDAQALGDLAALLGRGRRAARVTLEELEAAAR